MAPSKKNKKKARSQELKNEDQKDNWFLYLSGFAIIAASMLAYIYSANCDIKQIKEGSETEWWKSTIIYQVYPRSFQDTDGDGIGDLKGIHSHLDYFEYLGVEAIWLSPILTSPMVDFGYDVADFTNIDPMFGTMEDFDNLIQAIHEKGIRLIMDFIPNHTSDLHQWFQESCKGDPTSPYYDYYIWADGNKSEDGSMVPPNNWRGCFGGSAWTWNEERQQFYLHQFTKEQPDLDFRNPRVRQEMLDVLQFWLDRGVDGFRADAIRHMFEVADLSLDEPRSHTPGVTPEQYNYLLHPYTMNQPEVHDVLQEWRALFDNHQEKTGKYVFLVVEIFDTPAASRPYYLSGPDFPFNFNLQALNKSCDGFCVHSLVDSWWSMIPDGKWANWVIGSHDVPRISAKMGSHLASALNTILLLLPGTPTTYYGEEIGMEATPISFKETQDPFGLNFGPERYQEFSRDPSRSPMQWNEEKNGGFSTSDTTWLPVNPNYKALNVEAQIKDRTGNTPLQLYRKVAQLRKDQAFTSHSLQYAVVNTNIFSFIRQRDDTDPQAALSGYLVTINIGDRASTDNYRLPSKEGGTISVPKKGQVVFTTRSLTGTVSPLGSRVDLENVKVEAGEALVIKF